MKFLLDTNVYIFLLNDPQRLSFAQKNILEDTASELFLSTASLHEMAVKVRTGKLQFTVPFEEVTDKARRTLKIKLLSETTAHFHRLTRIEKINGHGDPFDFLIMAQAIVEKIPVLTSDDKFVLYQGVQAVL